MGWTEKQEQAINERNKNILVSAAAGSGKTAVLIERIKELIIKEKTDVSEFLIVTFTNAAAAQMKDRLSSSILKEIEILENAEEKDEETIIFLRKQLSKIGSANISTFHSFCIEAIRRYFYIIEVEPSFKICDEIQGTIFKRESLEEIVQEYFEDRNEEIKLLMDLYGSVRNEDGIKEMISMVYSFIRSIPDSLRWLSEKVEELNQDKESFLKSEPVRIMKKQISFSLKKAKTSGEKVIEILENEGLEELLKLANQDFFQIEEAYEKSIDSDIDIEKLRENVLAIKFAVFRAKKEEKEIYKSVQEDIKLLRDSVKKDIEKVKKNFFAMPIDDYLEITRGTYETGKILYSLVFDFHERYKEKKSEKGLLDFSDIEHLGLEVLSHENVANEYKDQFKHIFVDEYQDSNIIQESLINKISRDNNLFMVGDVKQSIYKFRLAEPEIFINKYDLYKENRAENSIKIDLSKNFRSKGNVLDLTNAIFEEIMEKETVNIAYDEDARLNKGSDYEGELDYKCQLHIIDTREIGIDGIEEVEDNNEEINENNEGTLENSLLEEITEMKGAQLEAAVLAKLVKENINIDIYDDGKVRKTTYRDIVILLRSPKNYNEIYMETLAKEGIPVYSDVAESYFDAIEVNLFICLLSVIDNKKNDIPLLSVLRSPIFKFELDELSEIRQIFKKGAFYSAFEKYSKEGVNKNLLEKCKDVLESFKKWKEKSEYMELSAFLYYLMNETGYIEYISALPYGKQREGNLLKIVDSGEQFQKSTMKGLFNFIEYIEQMRKSNLGPTKTSVITEGDDVVRIMSVHKSKGLEFPVVILGGIAKKFNRQKASYNISIHKDVGIGLKYVDTEMKIFAKTLNQNIIGMVKKDEETAEEMRILYVALTRAKDKLILLGNIKKDPEKLFTSNKAALEGNSFADWVLPIMRNKNFKGERWEVETYSRKNIFIEERDKEKESNDTLKRFETGFNEEEIEKKEIFEQITNNLNYKYLYKNEEKVPAKFSVSEIKKIISGEKVFGQKEVLSNEIKLKTLEDKNNHAYSGAERGTIIHKIMQYGSIENLMTLDGIDKMEKEMIGKNILSKEDFKEVDWSNIIDFAQSELGQRIKNSSKVYKEQPFVLEVEVEQIVIGKKVLVQGIIDCFFEEGDNFVLLDYKTDYVNKNISEEMLREKAEEHIEQINLYKKAIEISGKKVKEAYIVYLGIGRSVEI